MPRALVVADDLTGAIDTAHAFAARGYRTRVQVNPGRAPPDSTVLALNTDSRYADPETAAERVRRAIESRARWIPTSCWSPNPSPANSTDVPTSRLVSG